MVSARLVPTGDSAISSHSDGERFALTRGLVDADSGLMRSLRLVTYPARYSQLMYDAFHKQLQVPVDPLGRRASIEAVYSSNPRSKELAARATIVKRAAASSP